MSCDAVRFHDQHLFRIAEHGDVRIVRDKDQLTSGLHILHALHDNIVDEFVVKVILRLVNKKRSLAVQEQVMAIFTAVRGFLADIPVDKVVTFQNDFLKFMRQTHPEIGQKIAEQQKLDDNLEDALSKAIEEFKETVPYKTA